MQEKKILTENVNSRNRWWSISWWACGDANVVPCLWSVHISKKQKLAMSCIMNGNFVLKPHHRRTRFHAGTTRNIHGIPILDVQSNVLSICGLKMKLHPFLPYLSCLKSDFYQQLRKISLKTSYYISNIADSHDSYLESLIRSRDRYYLQRTAEPGGGLGGYYPQ